ncbi:DUF4134 family protein [Runella limosa]|uniref:DUF4134 family protein n=1 Tax=Runella limosa TaxID=370978 RepID=UPI00041829B4|nr:DUF4134 family protein [Runella limosa]
MKRVVFFVLISSKVLAQNIDLHSNQNGDLGIRGYFSKPLADKIPLFVDFSLVLVGIVAIVVSGKIYVRWQEGDENVISHITRWFFGLVVVLALLFFLKSYFQGYDFNISPNLNF